MEEDEWLKLHLGVHKTIELNVANLPRLSLFVHNILLNQEEADMELLMD